MINFLIVLAGIPVSLYAWAEFRLYLDLKKIKKGEEVNPHVDKADAWFYVLVAIASLLLILFAL